MKNKSWKRRAAEITWCLGTAVVTSAVLWWFLPLWLAGAMMFVIAVHEFGHYFAAVVLGNEADLPFFIPLVFGVIAACHIKFANTANAKKILMAGPIAGLVAAVALALFAILNSLMPMFWAALWLVAFQLWSLTFGSDARKYRKVRNAEAAQ